MNERGPKQLKGCAASQQPIQSNNAPFALFDGWVGGGGAVELFFCGLWLAPSATATSPQRKRALPNNPSFSLLIKQTIHSLFSLFSRSVQLFFLWCVWVGFTCEWVMGSASQCQPNKHTIQLTSLKKKNNQTIEERMNNKIDWFCIELMDEGQREVGWMGWLEWKHITNNPLFKRKVFFSFNEGADNETFQPTLRRTHALPALSSLIPLHFIKKEAS